MNLADKMRKMIRKYGDRANVPINLLPIYVKEANITDGVFFDLKEGYRLYIAERGKIIEQYHFSTEKAFLYRVFFGATFEMAVEKEATLRTTTEDPRKMIFMLQRMWMEQIDPDFLPQYDKEIEQLLREYPYRQDLGQFMQK